MTLRAGFRLGEWIVHPDQNRLAGPAGEVRLNSRAMDVLVYLATRAGEVVSREDFSQSVWGHAVVTDDSLTWCISELRRQLGDQASNPRFIETIPKRGYRLLVPAQPLEETGPADGPDQAKARRVEGAASAALPGRRIQLGIAIPVVLVALASWLFLTDRGPPPSMDRSIAVLPFENVSTNSHDPFTEGLHHDLLTRLSNIADLQVTSSTSVKQYHDSNQPIPEVAGELGVTWVLEGAVQHAADEIQLNAQLIDASTDSHLWARTYRRELTAENLFFIQAEIVDDIATSLQAHMSPAEQNRVARVPTDNLEAYALVIRADTLVSRRTESSMRQAVDLYRQAIDMDEGYADAWAGLASARTLLAYYGHAEREQSLLQARDDALKALDLDPDLPRGHSALGVVHMQLDRNGPAALAALERAHTLSGHHIGWFAWMQAVAGDLERALALTRRQAEVVRFAPSVNMSLAFLYLADRQPRTALEHARKARELSPGYATAWLLEGQVLLVQGEYREAIAVLQRALDNAGTDSVSEFQGWLVAARALGGETEAARDLVAGIEAADEPFALGIARLGLGEFEAATQALGRSEWDDFQTITLRYHPFLDPLRDDEDFRALIRRLDRSWGFE